MKNYKRPAAITIITAIGFLGLISSAFIVFTPLAASFGVWYQVYTLITVLVGAIIFWGFWTMQKWAPITYTILTTINQLVLAATEM